jgi:hypothetical protein
VDIDAVLTKMKDVKRDVVGEAFLQWVEANKNKDKNMKKMLKSFEGNQNNKE